MPVLPDDIRRLLAVRAGKAFRDRRDCAITRLFVDTHRRLEGIAGLRHNADDPRTVRRGPQITPIAGICAMRLRW